MATRKCGNIYFPKYVLAVRDRFLRGKFSKKFWGWWGQKFPGKKKVLSRGNFPETFPRPKFHQEKKARILPAEEIFEPKISKALHGRLAGRFKPLLAGRCNDFAPSRQKKCHHQKQPSRPGPRKKKKTPPRPVPSKKKKKSHPVPPRKKKTTAPSRLRKKNNRPVPPRKKKKPPRPAMCVCVFSSHPFWTSSSLDVPAGVTQEEGHTGFLIHLPSAVHALIFVARRIQPFLSLVDREVELVY